MSDKQPVGLSSQWDGEKVSEPMIRTEQRGSVTVLWIDRPPANAMNLALFEALDAALAQIERAKETRAVVIAGTGRSFSAGLDLKEVPLYGQAQQTALVAALNRVFGRLYGLPVPTVAAVNGHAIAGGCVLALTCDCRVGAEGEFQIGLTEARVGVPFPVGAMAIIQGELTPSTARRLVLQGRNVRPADALALGVLDELRPPEQTLTRALEVAEDMATIPSGSFAKIKRQLRAAALDRIEDAVRNETDPMLRSWLDEETPGAATAILRRDG